VATLTGTETFTNKRITPRVNSVVGGGAFSPSIDSYDQENMTAIASTVTFNNPTGTPVSGQQYILRLKDNGTARTLTWSGTQYRASADLPFPTTTIISKTMYLKFIYNEADTKWDFVSMLDNF
jgi:hypothetical protein